MLCGEKIYNINITSVVFSMGWYCITLGFSSLYLMTDIPGQCKCYRDYIGADCSIQESAAPSISSLEADGLCSLENGGCKTVLVSGGPFSEELSPKCHFQRAEVSVGTWIDGNYSHTLYHGWYTKYQPRTVLGVFDDYVHILIDCSSCISNKMTEKIKEVKSFRRSDDRVKLYT